MSASSLDMARPAWLLAHAQSDELAVVSAMRSALAPDGGAPPVAVVKALGLDLIRGAKAAAGRDSLVARLMNRYRLSTEEGVVLLSLAEALLRVPDAGTADLLLRDKIAGRDWTEVPDGADWPLAVTLSAHGLSLASATLLMDAARESPAGGPGGQAQAVLARLVARSGAPVIRRAALAAMRLLGQQFVMGEDIAESLRRMERAPRLLASFDMLGEAARTADDARRYASAYADAIAVVARGARTGDPYANHGISIKLSALHPRYEYLQGARRRAELFPVVAPLVAQARAANVPIIIDAEESDRLDPHLDMLEQLVGAGLADDWSGLGLVVQAYHKAAPDVIDRVGQVARDAGVRLGIRLVKGAYWDTEIKRAQVLGLDHFPVFTHKQHTDLAYQYCALRLRGLTDVLFPAFASHNAMTLAYVARLFAGCDHEYQRLHGMGDAAHEALLLCTSAVRPVRVYAPVGTHRDLLAYLVRRLLENGANSSFVNQFADPMVTPEDLAVDPRELPLATVSPIPSGRQLFAPERLNAAGWDLAAPGVASDLMAQCAAQRQTAPVAAPLVGGVAQQGAAQPVRSPVNGAVVGQAIAADAAMVAAAAALARQAQPAWSRHGGAQRAAILDRAADLMEQRGPLFLDLAMREAGKTLADAVAELREAVDFLRYYAAQARQMFGQPNLLPGPTGERNTLLLEGKGVFACISPWNFPLAIFTGQIAAALVTGNAVLAKPADQTPLIAAAAVRLLHDAGVPADVLHLLPGDGPVVGAAVVDTPGIAGVVFTGSTHTARAINRKLAARDGGIATLIAETGGINAMIVDSTALPEQVTRDVLASAFQSAGQRCSALRLLCVQDDVAAPMLAMIAGGMAELSIGDPADLSVDIGPIIDAGAAARIRQHVDQARAEGRILAEAARLSALPDGHFIAPVMIAVPLVASVTEEVFGPVLHVVRWKAGQLDRLIDDINALGFGLTLGVHSRIEAVADHIAARASAGNVYVNRNQIGAVVGCQPFGGRGLSGTGPKAGGPHYLPRFVDEKTVSVDVTAAGGNASLLTL